MKQKLRFTPEVSDFIKSFDASIDLGGAPVYTIPLKFNPVEGQEHTYEIDFSDRLLSIDIVKAKFREYPLTYKESIRKLHQSSETPQQ